MSPLVALINDQVALYSRKCVCGLYQPGNRARNGKRSDRRALLQCCLQDRSYIRNTEDEPFLKLHTSSLTFVVLRAWLCLHNYVDTKECHLLNSTALMSTASTNCIPTAPLSNGHETRPSVFREGVACETNFSRNSFCRENYGMDHPSEHFHNLHFLALN